MKIKHLLTLWTLSLSAAAALAIPLNNSFYLGEIGSSGSGIYTQPYDMTSNFGAFVDSYDFSTTVAGNWFTGVVGTSSPFVSLRSGSIDGTSLDVNGSLVDLTSALGVGSHRLILRGIANGNTSDSVSYSFNISPVPEPESFAMLLAGLGFVGFVSKRKKQQK